jgi:hypothetical protein
MQGFELLLSAMPQPPLYHEFTCEQTDVQSCNLENALMNAIADVNQHVLDIKRLLEDQLRSFEKACQAKEAKLFQIHEEQQEYFSSRSNLSQSLSPTLQIAQTMACIVETDETPEKMDLAIARDRIESDYSANKEIPILTSNSQKMCLRHQFMRIFNELDLNREGNIERDELDKYFELMRLPKDTADKLFAFVDTDNDGKIDRAEWFEVICRCECQQGDPEMVQFLQDLGRRHSELGYVYEEDTPSYCLLHHDHRFRISWDMLTLLSLSYIGITMPLLFAFGDAVTGKLRSLDLTIDVMFMVDIVFNFRTTFINANCEKVTQGKAIAKHYLKTWFLLDLVSSFPFDHVSSGNLPGSQPLKLLKEGKMIKVVKMARLGKLLRIASDSELVSDIEEFVWSSHCSKMIQIAKLVVFLLLAAHWLACFLVAADGNAVEDYLNGTGEEINNGRRYTSAYYWAMMTVSTVGYGDISMRGTF